MLRLTVSEWSGEPRILCRYDSDGGIESDVMRLLHRRLKKGSVLVNSSEGGGVNFTTFDLQLRDLAPKQEETTVDINQVKLYSMNDLLSMISFIEDNYSVILPSNMEVVAEFLNTFPKAAD